MTAPTGFRASGITAGLKPSGKPDLALVFSDAPAAVAVTTTTNRVKAAPVIITERHAADGRARGVILNSGGANACTGADGLEDAGTTAEVVAQALGVLPTDVLVCSTGIIGERLPIDRLLGAVPQLVAALGSDGGRAAAEAICTTDTTVKESAYEVVDPTGRCRVGGMAKGAGMIEPAMATLLAVITTDAPLNAQVLRSVVRQTVERTFNRISVDACGSTNDTVVVLANGQATKPPTLASFRSGLEAVCDDLARAIVSDGEGATKVAEIRVVGATTEADAEGLARAIARSVLFRAALHGSDPNWGRVLAAMGASDVEFDPDRVSVSIGDIVVCESGIAAPFDRPAAVAAMAGPWVDVRVDLGLGDAHESVLTADLTPQYVTENAYYTT